MRHTEEIFGDLATSLEGAIVLALRRDYEANADRHDEALGDNGQSFGWLVAHSAPTFLEELAGLPGISFSRPLNAFQVELCGMVLHPCKAGSALDDSVHAAVLDGSLTRQRFVAENSEQLALFTGDDGRLGWRLADHDPPALRHLVIAHCGNPQEGLCWVAVGAPHSDGRNGSPWHWVEEIHRRRPIQTELDPPVTDKEPITPFDELPEPEPALGMHREGGDEARGTMPV